jgi:hypothetical protein
MTKKRDTLISCCLFAVALLLAVYGGGFSWRNVIVASVALMLLTAGGNLWNAAFAPQPFTRYQFRIQISHLGLALKDAGLYDGEIPEAVEHIYKGMSGHGSVIFTWLESELFFVNTTNHYSSRLEITMDLPAYRAREAAHRSQLADMIEMRRTNEGYELVLLTREQRYSDFGNTRDKGLVLFKLPYKLFGALQGDQFQSDIKATEILETTGLVYHLLEGVSDGWDYRNKYGTFRWWEV